MFFLSLEILDKFEVPESFILAQLEQFDLQHRDDGRGDAVSVSHHVNRIIQLWRGRNVESAPDHPKPNTIINPYG